MSSKDKILKSAQDLFYRNGYMATSVDEIIEEAGVAKSNFYYHFRSKEDLGIRVLEQRREDFEAVAAATLGNTGLTPRQRLDAYLDFLIEAQESRCGQQGCPFGNLVAEVSGHSERFRSQLSAMFGGLVQVVADVVAAGQQAGEFRRDVEPSVVADLIVQSVQGMHLMAKCHQSVSCFGRGARLLVTLLDAAPAPAMT